MRLIAQRKIIIKLRHDLQTIEHQNTVCFQNQTAPQKTCNKDANQPHKTQNGINFQ